MKKTSEKSPKKKSSTKAAKPMAAVRGADLFVQCLEREGVDVIFAYPGGASMEIHQGLTRSGKIRTILPRHEQGCGFMAHGYARTTGKAGVCMATSGPGATNLVTCVADAQMDSIPLIAITGQVHQSFIGKNAFQETDVFGMTLPIVKHSYLVLNIKDIPRVVKEAFYIAQTGRPGPVVIDIAKDVQQAYIEGEELKEALEAEMAIPGYSHSPKATDEELNAILDACAEAKRPVIYTGGGIVSGNAEEELKEFAEITGFPMTSTLMGLGGFDENHPQSLRWFGMHGGVAGNWAVCESSLLLALGARFDDRITGAIAKFAPEAKVAHIDIDKSEHHKNKIVDFPVHSEIKYALKRLCELAKKRKFKKPDIKDWTKKVNGWKEEFPFQFEESPHIIPQLAIQTLYEETEGEAIISTGVGQHQMWAAQFYKFHKTRSYISSLGLGTMGFGLPAALGAKVACPDRTVVDIDGDGSFMMNVQELATAIMEKIPVKIMLMNNQHLGMVVQWEDILYEGTRGQTVLGHPDNIGGPENLDALYPDWPAICKGFGVKSRRVVKKKDLRAAIREMIDHDGPFLLDVVVPYTEHVMPFIPAGASAKDILIRTNR
ncbi:biosynthetic-type acetolactate synthase large subunit [Puniceicoccales bacterium CK1056]|uniref:Acetolactate synthase n=1 Tax=Oceanipulchritudo coccoides TaxID=2706888 RepID=A0A6B2LXL9_9BACT|nr:biosynthetic-type acetolactate synthase large subunit [Oceanipulchritudo coccoides]NDV61023.1 biosynthetic-type acetolactate synthase large subunit [Oceanipulchritudo coccoides]